MGTPNDQELVRKEKNKSIIIIEDEIKGNKDNNPNGGSTNNSNDLSNLNHSSNSDNPRLWTIRKKRVILFIISLLNMVAPFCNA